MGDMVVQLLTMHVWHTGKQAVVIWEQHQILLQPTCVDAAFNSNNLANKANLKDLL